MSTVHSLPLSDLCYNLCGERLQLQDSTLTKIMGGLKLDCLWVVLLHVSNRHIDHVPCRQVVEGQGSNLQIILQLTLLGLACIVGQMKLTVKNSR